jgi:hypothetical protein
MAGMFSVRGMDEETKKAIHDYAKSHEMTVAEAIRDLVFFGLQHIKHTKKEKKYKSIFDVYGKLKFKGGTNLSQEIDEVVYG